MITAIFTTRQKTTLSIETSEELHLVQMGHEDTLIELGFGANVIVVPAGVFKVLSMNKVVVTADDPEVHVAFTTNNKDSGFPDPPKSNVAFDRKTLHQFFVDGRSQPAPR